MRATRGQLLPFARWIVKRNIQDAGHRISNYKIKEISDAARLLIQQYENERPLQRKRKG